MGMFLFSAVGLPTMAIALFAIIEAASSSAGLWSILSESGLDVCKVSIGIVAALFYNIPIQAAASAGVLFFELIVAAIAILISKRVSAARQPAKTYGILGVGIISLVVPAVLIVLYGAH